MESAQWPRVVWQRAPEPPSLRKNCKHPFCPWQHCELRLYALFWAENSTFLDIYEERNSHRREVLMARTQINLLINHITIIQCCNQKTRVYRFNEDPTTSFEDWMIPGRLPNGPLLRYFKPSFEVVYQHKGCLQAGQSIPIIVRGANLAESIYYRRCNGQYRNACGQVLKRSVEGRPVTTKAIQQPAQRLERPFIPYMTSDVLRWAEDEARKHDGAGTKLERRTDGKVEETLEK